MRVKKALEKYLGSIYPAAEVEIFDFCFCGRANIAVRALTSRACPRCQVGWPGMGAPPVEDEAHYWAECPSLLPARRRMLAELEGAYPGFVRQCEALPRLEKKGRALAFGVPDGTWAPGACRTTWARGARAVVQFGVERRCRVRCLGW